MDPLCQKHQRSSHSTQRGRSRANAGGKESNEDADLDAPSVSVPVFCLFSTLLSSKVRSDGCVSKRQMWISFSWVLPSFLCLRHYCHLRQGVNNGHRVKDSGSTMGVAIILSYLRKSFTRFSARRKGSLDAVDLDTNAMSISVLFGEDRPLQMWSWAQGERHFEGSRTGWQCRVFVAAILID